MADLFDIALARKLSGGGGGGSSDFSTAQVTFNVTFPSSEDIFFLSAKVPGVAYQVTSLLIIEGICATEYEFTEDSPTTLEVLMFGESGKIVVIDGENVSVTGNASYDSETKEITFTGDFTVTLTAVEP